MRSRLVRMMTIVLVGIAGVAAGCAVSGGTAGIALGAAAMVAAWIALAASGSSACYSSHRDDSADRGVCLSFAEPDAETTNDRGMCLTVMPPDAEPCLSALPPDAETTDERGPCLAPPAPDARTTDALPPCPPEFCYVCLDIAEPCELICPTPDAGDSAYLGPAGEARERLASLGVLSRDQIARLERLRGRG